jgi:hypothetical protein
VRKINRDIGSYIAISSRAVPRSTVKGIGQPAAGGATLSEASSSLGRCPRLAERPDRNPKQREILDEELPRLPREGGETAGTRLPDTRCVKRKLRVVRNIPTARALPSAETRGKNGRRATRIATVTSITPRMAEKLRTLSNPYAQLISGLLATYRWIPWASYAVNFMSPIHPTTTTRP